MALYFLYPTYRDYELHQQLKDLHGPDSLQFVEKNDTEIRENRGKAHQARP